MSVVEGQTPGPILIWRGYTDGHVETSDEAGAPKKQIEAALQGVRYACNATAQASWSAEFSIPFSAMGTVQRATNTPATMPSEIIKGEKPSVTSLVGASAAPSHAPAASPHITPSLCRERDDRA